MLVARVDACLDIDYHSRIGHQKMKCHVSGHQCLLRGGSMRGMNIMNSMKLVIPLYLLYWSIHTKDESKRGTAFAFIFGVN